MKTVVFVTAMCLMSVHVCLAQEVLSLEPAGDVSIFEDAPNNASGQEAVIYVGVTGPNVLVPSPRRALLKFDLSVIPGGAEVTAVSLQVHVQQSGPGAGPSDPHNLHRVTTAWTEGPATGAAGMGVPASSGDVTWTHAVFSTTTWNNPGGDFVATSSSGAALGFGGSSATFTGPGLVADVQHFLDNPEENHGWVLIGDENGFGNARRIHSRSATNATVRPVLEITYSEGADPAMSDVWFLF